MIITTGDGPIVDEWVNNWFSESGKQAIVNHFPDLKYTLKLRVSVGRATITKPLGEQVQLVINYNSQKDCYLVWNAAIQCHIHKGKKIKTSFGKKLADALSCAIDHQTITPVFQETKCDGVKCVELVLIVGKDAIDNFCRNYQEVIRPNPELIPKGKKCLYAVAGGKIEFISAEEGNESCRRIQCV